MTVYALPKPIRNELLPQTVLEDTSTDGWTCFDEFGPHPEHSTCQRVFDLMSNPGYPDEIDYSAWYGGEQGFNDGLRWSDFV